MAVRKAAGLLSGGQGDELPETIWYTAKRRLLGPPMINAQLREQRLSKTLALGVLSPDGISSSAYGTEEILIELMHDLRHRRVRRAVADDRGDLVRHAARGALLPRGGHRSTPGPAGSYVVARENFGPRIAQVAAVALLIDYVVTVAVQIAAGTRGRAPLRSRPSAPT